MNERETEKRKWPVTAPVRNKQTAMDFTNITAISWGISAKGGEEI
jgi:hypothetical protein